jgi:hypothetical protein
MQQKIIRLFFRFTILISLIGLYQSCSITTRFYKSITIESEQIPPAVAKEKFTFIGVLKGKRSYDKYLKKGFARYTGNYVLCKQNEIDAKYGDAQKYRFVLDYVMEKVMPSSYAPGNAYHFFIYDRIEEKSYWQSGNTNFFYEAIANYVIAVDTLRKK